VLAIITVCDPVVSITLAAVFLHEKLASSPAGIAGEVVALLVMTAGTAFMVLGSAIFVPF